MKAQTEQHKTTTNYLKYLYECFMIIYSCGVLTHFEVFNLIQPTSYEIIHCLQKIEEAQLRKSGV